VQGFSLVGDHGTPERLHDAESKTTPAEERSQVSISVH
jgi:hypothetical protein